MATNYFKIIICSLLIMAISDQNYYFYFVIVYNYRQLVLS